MLLGPALLVCLPTSKFPDQLLPVYNHESELPPRRLEEPVRGGGPCNFDHLNEVENASLGIQQQQFATSAVSASTSSLIRIFRSSGDGKPQEIPLSQPLSPQNSNLHFHLHHGTHQPPYRSPLDIFASQTLGTTNEELWDLRGAASPSLAGDASSDVSQQGSFVGYDENDNPPGLVLRYPGVHWSPGDTPLLSQQSLGWRSMQSLGPPLLGCLPTSKFPGQLLPVYICEYKLPPHRLGGVGHGTSTTSMRLRTCRQEPNSMSLQLFPADIFSNSRF